MNNTPKFLQALDAQIDFYINQLENVDKTEQIDI